MDWNALKSFLAIVEAGSLAGAAKAMGVNHSTVYRRLQALEAAIGAKLFNQVDNHYVLTPLGEELAAHGQAIGAGFDDIERVLVGKEVQPKGTVRITAPFNLANRYIPPALAQFRHEYPEIEIEVLSSNQEVNMNSRAADIAVRATQSPPQHLLGRKVASFPWGMFASPDYIAQSGPLKTLEDLSQHHLIGGTGSMLNLPAFAWLEKHHGSQITTRCDELTAMSFFAENGQGVAIMPLDQQRESLVWLGAFTPAPVSDIWLLSHPDLRKTERVRLVMQCLVDYFQSDALGQLQGDASSTPLHR